ncbi:MAG: winged helix-turn-helix domain-containing protein [Pseudomonadota bacterium]
MVGIDKQYRFADLVLSTGQHALWRGTEKIELAPTSFAFLLALLEAAPSALSVDTLIEQVWPGKIVAPETVSQRVRLLRQVLGDNAQDPRYVRGIRGFGYQLVPDVSTLAHDVPTVLFGNAANGDTPLPLPDQPSIVVVPFVDDGRSVVSRRVAIGVSHDIHVLLARTRSFFVIARGSALRYASIEPDPARLSRELGVRYVLHGKVSYHAATLAVHATLVDGVTHQVIWEDLFERSLDEVFDLQQDVTEAVSSAVQVEIDRQERRRAMLNATANVDAWAAFHIGCHHMYTFSAESLDETERWFTRAISLDPTAPRPHAGLSWVHWQRVFLGLADDSAPSAQAALESAQQALLLDREDPFGHWAYGRALLLNRDLDKALVELGRTTELNPSFAVGRYSHSFALMQAGESKAAVAHAAAAARLSPYDPLLSLMLGAQGFSTTLQGDYANGAGLLVQATQQPNLHYAVFAKAAVACSLAGRDNEAHDYLSRVRTVKPAFGKQAFLDLFMYQRPEDLAVINTAFERLEA